MNTSITIPLYVLIVIITILFLIDVFIFLYFRNKSKQDAESYDNDRSKLRGERDAKQIEIDSLHEKIREIGKTKGHDINDSYLRQIEDLKRQIEDLKHEIEDLKNENKTESDISSDQENNRGKEYVSQSRINGKNDDSVPRDNLEKVKTDLFGKKLYASSYNKEKKTFYEISPVTTENTIYVMSFMTESDSEAELNIFSGAKEIIMACRDYLEICCDTIGHGNELKVEKPGLVVLENGKWSIKKKVMVKFF